MTGAWFPDDFDGACPFHIEFAARNEKRLRRIFAEAGVKNPWFAGDMPCGRDGKTRKQVANCDLTREQFDMLKSARFAPIIGTRHAAGTSSIPLPPRRRLPGEAYTLQHDMKIAPPLRLTKGPGP